MTTSHPRLIIHLLGLWMNKLPADAHNKWLGIASQQEEHVNSGDDTDSHMRLVNDILFIPDYSTN